MLTTLIPRHPGTPQVAYADETQRQGTETTQVPGWIEVAGIAALLDPCILKGGQLSNETASVL